MEPMTIGKVARAAGVNVETVRYYERRGLIRQPTAPGGAYRVYPPKTVDRIRSIKRAQGLGFSLEEVRSLLSMSEQAETRCADVEEQARRKMEEIDARIRSLRAVRRALKKLADACRRELRVQDCPIIKNLSDPP